MLTVRRFRNIWKFGNPSLSDSKSVGIITLPTQALQVAEHNPMLDAKMEMMKIHGPVLLFK